MKADTRRDPADAADAADRDRRVSVDASDLEKHDQPLGLRLRPTYMRRLRREAESRGVGPSTLGRVILEKWLDREEP